MSGFGPGSEVAGLQPPSDNPPAVAFTSQQPLPTGDADGGKKPPDSGLVATGEEDGDEKKDEKPFVGNALAGYISNSWARNKRARDRMEHRLLACLRARRGVYSDGELGEMWTADAGEPIYLPLAATKMRAAEAALRELLLPDGERPWGLDPSPIPELPPEVEGPIMAQASAMARQQMAQLAKKQGQVMLPGQFETAKVQIAERLKDETIAAIRKEAKERAGRMEDTIEERMERGGYYKAIAEYVQHFCTYPAAVLKGPFLRRGKRLVWLKNGDPDVVNHPEQTWVAVNPFDCFPAPEAETCQDGDFIERVRMSRADLFECIDTPGYNTQAIRNVLASHASGSLRGWLWTDAERRMLEGNTDDVWIQDYLVDCLHFWGSVEGRTLIDYGIKEGVGDPLAYYEVDAVMIGTEVIRCEINDDPLGRRPYHNASYDPVPGAFWGNSIYELMRDCQAMVNACARALNANLGLASGPIMGIDLSQLAAGQDPKAIRPLQVIQLDRSRAQAAASPIEWYQADSRATELLGIISQFEAKADDLTGIPRYLNGSQDASGAAETASGLSMLMSSAAKGLQRAVANIDRGVIRRTVEAAYVHEMLYNPDETIKGDCTINARGAAAILVKEHLLRTRTQFLAMTANPIDMQIIGMKGRRAILAEVAKNLSMPVNDIVPTEQEFNEAQQQKVQTPPQPSPDAKLKSQTDITKTHMNNRTKLIAEGAIHPAAGAELAAQADNLGGPGQQAPGPFGQQQPPVPGSANAA